MALMQVMPGTFAELTRRYGLGSDPYDPRANILAGAAYLREMYDRYGPAHFPRSIQCGAGSSGRSSQDRATASLRDPALHSDVDSAAHARCASSAPCGVRSGAGSDDSLTPIRALALPPSRLPAQRRIDPAHAPVFVAMNSALPSPSRHAEAQAERRPFRHAEARRSPRGSCGSHPTGGLTDVQTVEPCLTGEAGAEVRFGNEGKIEGRGTRLGRSPWSARRLRRHAAGPARCAGAGESP